MYTPPLDSTGHIPVSLCTTWFCIVLHNASYPTGSISEAEHAPCLPDIVDLLRFYIFCRAEQFFLKWVKSWELSKMAGIGSVCCVVARLYCRYERQVKMFILCNKIINRINKSQFISQLNLISICAQYSICAVSPFHFTPCNVGERARLHCCGQLWRAWQLLKYKEDVRMWQMAGYRSDLSFLDILIIL